MTTKSVSKTRKKNKNLTAIITTHSDCQNMESDGTMPFALPHWAVVAPSAPPIAYGNRGARTKRTVRTGILLVLLAILSWSSDTTTTTTTLRLGGGGFFVAAQDWATQCDSVCTEEYCFDSIYDDATYAWTGCNQCYDCYICDNDAQVCTQYLEDRQSDTGVYCDFYDPECEHNYYWREGNGIGMDGSPTHILTDLNVVESVTEYDDSISIDCDNMTNFDNIFEFVYTCIYDENFWILQSQDDDYIFSELNFAQYNQPAPNYCGLYCDENVDSECRQDPEIQACKSLVVDQLYNGADNTDCEAQGSNCFRATGVSNFEDRMQTCRLFYSPTICGRCKFGMARILGADGIYCGYVSGTNDDGTPLCSIDISYQYAGLDISAETYVQTNQYFNHTTGIAEALCITTDLYTDEIDFFANCTSLGSLTWFDDLEDWPNLSAAEQARAEITIGCAQCDYATDSLPVTVALEAEGIYAQYCKYVGDQQEQENDICDVGAILQWTGILESERVLDCVSCSALIPDCLSCTSAKQCDLCKKGSRLASIVDAFGATNQVCVTDFCGFYGEGSGCAGAVGLEGCARSQSLWQTSKWIESCVRCQPGYALEVDAETGKIWSCNPQKGKNTIDLFIAPYDSKFVTEDLNTDQTFEGNPEEWPGFSIKNPYHQLQYAFNLLQGQNTPLLQYSEVSLSIYLFKGAHHYVRCVDEDLVDFSDVGDYQFGGDLLSLMCFSEAMAATTDPGACADSACSAYSEIYRHASLAQVYVDNVALKVQALDCALEHTVFARLDPEGMAALRENCADVSAGERPQIRLPNTYTSFNITNHAVFENIEFTGEDLFAEAKLDGAHMGYMGEQGILAFMPFTKCQIQEDPAKLTTIDDITIKKMDFVKVRTDWQTVEEIIEVDEYGTPVLDENYMEVVTVIRGSSAVDFDYECVSNFNKTAVEPPDEVDVRCNPEDYDPSISPNSASCSGEPYNDDFFHYSATNGAFTKRHKVLFNLYAFDQLRTLSTRPPQLEIINCKFKFFVNKLDALIQVENNNLGFIGEDPELAGSETDDRLLSYYGEDRGAMITIENSEFLSNSFSKGVIYYSQFQSISYAEAPQLLNFTANFQGTREVDYDEKSENYVRIRDSLFHNNAFHSVIQALSLDTDTTARNAADEFANSIDFRKFKDQGLIMNIDGYTGAIEVANSTFTSNMAYIQEILMYESISTDTYYAFNDKEMLIQFSDAAQVYLQFKKCVDKAWTGKYFFREVIDPNAEFDDALVVNTLENVSPFMIKGNRDAVIFSQNYFEGNIGTTGGVIHIEDPDFRYGGNPSIVITKNQFVNNMAYWAGNAFHIQMKMRMLYGDSSAPETTNDAQQTCGSGILIDNNYFYGNVGLKRHNGGAGVIRCQHYTETAEDQFTYLSGKVRQTYFETNAATGEKSLVDIDQPLTHYSELGDLFDTSYKYELLTYGTLIVNNTFSNNYSGQKGSALLIELINEIQIIGNKFMSNGPVQTYREIEFSPYYKNFLYNKRTLAYYLLNKDALGDCVDESAWLNRCYRDGYQIDMPQLQGTIYLANCHTPDTCWRVGDASPLLLAPAFFEKFYRPWQNAQIKNNYFYDNSANIVMFETQTQPQASALFIRGGTHTHIEANEFTGHRNWADSHMKTFAYDVWRYFPKNYFKYSHAALIRVEYPFSVYAEVFGGIMESEDGISIQTQISNNVISDNLNMQVVTFKSLRYNASIVDFDCKILYGTLTVHGNEVTRNQFIGKLSTFFYLNGGIASVEDNNFSFNGLLTLNKIVQTASDFNRQYQSSAFPWEDYEFDEAQSHGMFSFKYDNIEVPIKKAHIFRRNSFRHIYCHLGCAYFVEGQQIQQFVFTDNTYSFMVASQGSAVFYGTLALQQSNALAQVWIQSYRNEIFDRIYGGSIQLEGNNVPVTFIENSKFINNFGDTGAAISFNKGGGLFISETEFTIYYQDEQISSQLRAEPDSRVILQLLEQLRPSLYQEIYDSYDSRLAQDSLISKPMFDEISKISSQHGQVYLLNNLSTVENESHPVVAFDFEKLADLVDRIHEIKLSDESTSGFSSMKDIAFVNNAGLQASSVFIDASSLQLLGTNDEPNFKDNVTPQGPTILAKQSAIISRRMNFIRNKGNQGACFQIDSFSTLTDTDSVYSENTANQGGVIFAINDSRFNFINARFSHNYAQGSGSVLYAMYNSHAKALSFSSCTFERNYAELNLMQLMSSVAYIEHSKFVDNAAEIVNHGITMITSSLDFANSTVTNSEEFSATLTDEALSSVDTGFFSLFLSSTITIRDHAKISNLKALNQAVLSAQSMSSVYVENEVHFENNSSTNSAGQTFSLQNTNVVQINDAYFDGNPQTNIRVELGQLELSNTDFTRGKRNHIKGYDSSVRLSRVNIHDSEDTQSGHGFVCSRCWYVSVEDSSFQNLRSTGGSGGAILLQNLKNVTYQPISHITNSLFTGNKATSGGALHLDATHLLEVSGNVFRDNEALYSDGGAIKYTCNPTQIDYSCTVALINNEFSENKAQRKGGALRYENSNFTDVPLMQDGSNSDENSLSIGRILQSLLSDLDQETVLLRPWDPAAGPPRNDFVDNEAAYGDDLASFPKYIEYIVPENQVGAKIDLETGAIQIAAGQEFEVDLVIRDREGRVYADENEGIAKIIFKPGQELGSKALMVGSEAVAKNGKFQFNAFKVRIQPSTSALITFQFQRLEHYGTEIEFLDFDPIFTVTARPCVEGEQYTEDLSCKPCPASQYLYERQTEPGVCEDCPPEAFCYGMNITAPRPSYWRSHATGEDFTPCLRPESCLGGNETDPIGQCETGYQGVLCGDCANGYSRAGQTCSECPEVVLNIFIFAGLLFAVVFLIAFMVRSTLGGVATKKPLYQVFLKIFLNHFQILAAVSQIDFKWPSLIQSVLASQQGIADGPSQVLSVDCIIMDMFPGASSSFRLYYVRLIMFAMMPFIIFGVSQLFWAIYGRCKKILPQERGDKGTATAIIVLFLFYPTIVTIISKSVNCISIEGETRLYDDLEEICYEGTHLIMLLTVSLPALFGWVIGIPVYALYKLASNVEALRQIQEFSAGRQHEDLLRRFKVRLGFLTAGYSDQYYYWEIYLLARKSLLVMMIVFLSSVSSGVQSLSAILCLMAFFLVQWRYQPYYDPALNQMETLSLGVIILTIYAGLYYQAGEGDPFMESQPVTWIIFFAVLAPSLVFAINFARKMWVEVLKVIANKSANVFRFVTCGMKDLTQFRMQYMDDADDGGEQDNYEKEAGPKEENLQGFKAKSDDVTDKMRKSVILARNLHLSQRRESLEDAQAEAEELGVQSDQERSSANNSISVLEERKQDSSSYMSSHCIDSSSEQSIDRRGQDSARSRYTAGISGDFSVSDTPGLVRRMPQSDQQQEEGAARSIALKQQQEDSANIKPNSTQKQNFEYKDEVQFRGEKVTGGDRRKVYEIEDECEDGPAQDSALTTNQKSSNFSSLGQKPGRKNQSLEDSFNAIGKNAKNSSSNALANVLGQVRALKEKEEDTPFANSRNNQQALKSGVNKAFGVTMQTQSKDDVQEKTKEWQARMQHLKKPTSLDLGHLREKASESDEIDSGLEQSDNYDDPADLNIFKKAKRERDQFNSSRSKRGEPDPSDNKKIARVKRDLGQSKIVASKIYSDDEEGPDDGVWTARVNRGDQAAGHEQPSNRKRRSDRDISDPVEPCDDDFLSQDEGIGGKSIRGNTQRQKSQPQRSKRSRKRSPRGGNQGHQGANGDDLSVAQASERKPARGKSSRRQAAAASDFISDEEGGLDMTIRGNTERKQQQLTNKVQEDGKTVRAERSVAKSTNAHPAQSGRAKSNKSARGEKRGHFADRSSYDGDLMSAEEEGKAVATLRGDTQRANAGQEESKQVTGKDVFYKDAIESTDLRLADDQAQRDQQEVAAKEADAEAKEIPAVFNRRKRKRNNKKKTGKNNKNELNIFKSGQGDDQIPGGLRKNTISQQLMELQHKQARKEQGLSSDDSLDFL